MDCLIIPQQPRAQVKAIVQCVDIIKGVSRPVCDLFISVMGVLSMFIHEALSARFATRDAWPELELPRTFRMDKSG